MQTAPSVWGKFKNRASLSLSGIIVHISKGASDWYLCPKGQQFELTDVKCYPLLLPGLQIQQEIDIFTRNWSIGELNCTFSNQPYKKDSSSALVRLSDEWTDLRGAAVNVYLLAGGLSTQLSDCLLNWVGDVVSPARYDPNQISFVANDRIMQFFGDKIGRKAIDVFKASDDDADKMVPIAFGSFDPGGIGVSSLLLGRRGRSEVRPFYIVADHPMSELHALYLQADHASVGRGASSTPLNDRLPFKVVTSALDNDTFLTHVSSAAVINTGSQTDFDCEVSLFANSADNFAFPVEATYVPPSDITPIQDDDATTYVDVADTVDAGAGGYTSQLLLQFNRFILFGSNTGVSLTCYVNMEEHPDLLPITGTYTVEAKIIDAELGGGGGGSSTIKATETITPGTPTTGTFFTYIPSYTHTYNNIGLLLEATYTGVTGDSVDNNNNIMRVFQINLLVKAAIYDPTAGYASGKGAIFGSYIDAGGRSNSFNSGDYIDDPAMIIEKWLRDFLDVDSSLIDSAYFDAAIDASIVQRIQILDFILPADFVRLVCEQSMLVFFVSNLGLVRVLNLAVADPAIVRTIEYSHVVDGADGIVISKSDYIVNKADIKYNYRAEFGQMDSVATYENTDSQELFGDGDADRGTFKGSFDWPYLNTDNADALGAALFEDEDSLLAFEHVIIDLATWGHTNADLEVGDYVSFNAPAFDAQLKLPNGETWADKKFLITRRVQSEDLQTEFRFVEVHRAA